LPEESIEIAITVPQAELQTLVDALSRDPSLKPDVLPSSGAEGGGALAVLVITMGKAAIALVATALGTLVNRTSVKIVVGRTTLEGKNLRGRDLPVLLNKVLGVELKRLKASKKK